MDSARAPQPPTAERSSSNAISGNRRRRPEDYERREPENTLRERLQTVKVSRRLVGFDPKIHQALSSFKGKNQPVALTNCEVKKFFHLIWKF